MMHVDLTATGWRTAAARALLYAFLSAAPFAVGSAPASAGGPDPTGPVAIDDTAEYMIASKVLGSPVRVAVWTPKGEPPVGGFPVVYSFDADFSFTLFAGLAENLAMTGRSVGKAPPVIVAVGYPDRRLDTDRRLLDMTPPSDHPAGRFDMPERPHGKPWSPLGGGDVYLDMLVQEVKPFVSARFPVDPERETLYGHSLGGLMTLHALFTRPDSFDAYVASSASLWVNNGQMLREATAFFDRAGEALAVPIPLRLTVGSQEEDLTRWERQQPGDLVRRRAWVAGNRMVGRARDLAELIAERGAGQIDLTFEVLDGEGHLSAHPVSVYRALVFAMER
ncbi:alpha/beta hydrolase [Polymorphum gilvum]|uniref:Siderophore esterase IroE-like, putative n=1 Tax=Polymorphum gilvum (strain LMG 25793 / CGMCC 1.9160 / SL003B-26A1) TaxID=991905 RepID=F2J052_POLGS|nr:alpha/beta hydrolase-fold protein [Polymorphum gilvum]ADZ71887.1 Siderophore esterase IroE-like, putative [Polymorphum gilvum SL003B-26A1]